MIFGNGLRKVKKSNPIKQAVLQTPPDLTGAIFVYGRIKSGKTVSILSLAGLYHDNPNRKYKIIDFWGGSRNEHLYWGLPSNQNKYWNYVKKYFRLDKEGPRQYKVTYYYPLIGKKMEKKKLPFNPPNVTSKIFTIPIRDIESKDLALEIGQVPDNINGIWKDILSDSKKTTTSLEILEEFQKKSRKGNVLYNAVLKPLIKCGFLQGDSSELNLTQKDISKILDDQEEISVICLDFVDEEHKLFVIGYLLRKICQELDRKRRKVIGVFRESSEFFRVGDQSVAPDRIKVMKAYLSDWIRMGRRGLHLLLDTQSPSETRGIVDGQQDLTLLGRLPSEADRKMATDQLYRDGFMTKKQVTQLGAMNPGQFMFCPSGKNSYYAYILLPKCRYWQEKNGNFYKNVWEKEVGRWINFKEEIQRVLEPKSFDKTINSKPLNHQEYVENIVQDNKIRKEKIISGKDDQVFMNHIGVMPEEFNLQEEKQTNIKNEELIIETKNEEIDPFEVEIPYT